MTIRDEEIIRDKLNFYKEREEPVHIKLITPYVNVDVPFRNGKIQEMRDNSVVLIDEKLGEILIYLKEIKDVDKREVKR